MAEDQKVEAQKEAPGKPEAGQNDNGAVQKASHKELEFMLDIPLNISVELGRSKIVVNELLQFTEGSIVELTKLAGEPVEVYINEKLVAKGEVVIVKDKYGVRLTDIMSPIERAKSLYNQ